MKSSRIKLVLFCGLFLAGSGALLPAQQVVSGIFGYSKLTLLGNSDTFVALPFARLPDAAATVSNVTGNVIQAQGAPGWTNGQFVYAAGTQTNTYYVRFDSGALEGRYFDVTNNSSDTLSLNLAGGSLAGASTNDQVSVVPYWTLGTVFVNGNGIWPSTSPFSQITQVLIPNSTGSGVNLSSSATYYYYTNAGTTLWRKVGSSMTNLNDDILRPNNYIVIRHTIPSNTVFVSYGDVVLTKIALPLSVNAASSQDNPVALTRPAGLSLIDSALVSGGGFAPTTSPFSIQDTLIVFDNTTTNFNKSAAATYYFYNSIWRKVGDSTDYGTSNVLTPGAGFIIRKVSGLNSVLWTNPPTYTNN